MEFWKKLAEDVRTNLVGLVLVSIIGSGAVTGGFALVRSQLNSPVTTRGALTIFLVSLFGIAVVYTIKKYREGAIKIGSVAEHQNPIVRIIPIFFKKLAIPGLIIVVCVMAGCVWFLSRKVHTLQVEIVRYLLPRQLTDEQIAVFGKYLSEHSAHHVVTLKWLSEDPEAGDYARSFAQAFQAGKWIADMSPISASSITCFPIEAAPAQLGFRCESDFHELGNGVSINTIGPPSKPQPPPSADEIDHPRVSLRSVIGDALRAAQITDVGSGGRGDDTDASTTVVMEIAARPRDKYAVVPRKFWDRNKPQDQGPLSDSDF